MTATSTIRRPNPQTAWGTVPLAGRPDAATRALLGCGAAAGVLFVLVAAGQVALRDGFDLGRHPLSLLALGDWGWVQRANFVLSGALSVAAAAGLRRALRPGRACTWGPLLVAAYGVGLVVAGCFTADPSMGFPAGAPAGNPDHLSTHAVLHGVGAMLAFPAVIAATGVLARRYAGLGRRAWAASSAATGAAALAVVAWPAPGSVGPRLAIGSVLVFGWLAAVSLELAVGTRRPTR